ncbi:nucleotidyltransferase family protein [Clostridium botulinum]|uniref:Nucleotidyl transferase n=2 Tax=Clostridium botulinum TaxID=1491 RepID=A0A0A0IE70_CLOBO|nr:nucleotidyltransferase family protein [Clostridium botulinum]KGM97331.1 nucleotidyl transferase [Clostridium botulinum D str. CCUG 7971]KGM99242.1 nucleotidyl transferase [Clostridium botulinum C/D str. DC5]KOC46964.1 nucleotidyl transferase [Clostridium botulinum]KOC55063.1 nucleotidyl transferase [Clostridium botulinum]KOC56108.1 nucleotidyl transferase [Clostridium botulinum]
MKFSMDMYCVSDDATIKDAMESIDKNLIGAVFITNKDKKVIGVVTDGNVRRAILKGYTIADSVKNIYHTDFKYVNKLVSKQKVKEKMLKYNIRQLPLLDEEGKLIDLYFLDHIISYDKKDNYVFILAGGLGTRLRPLTENIPKPMLKIGGKPMLERIIEQFKGYGFVNFIISINYKGEIIEDYFKDGSDFDVNIQYVREEKKLGTAGSINLAKEKFDKDFLVINGDILTGIDFETMLNHHIENKFDITAGARNYEMKVPYGVMITEDKIIKSLEEKPTYNFYINSGVYVLSKNVINYIPKDTEYNMTDLIEDVIKAGGRCGTYNITEYWSDIGHIEDYKKANEDVNKFF